MPLDVLKLSLALGALALTSSAALAGAGSHGIGPHSKSQLTALCVQESGQLSLGATKWGCTAKAWTIACVKSGEICVIDLYGSVGPDGETRTFVASVGFNSGTGGTGGAGGTGGTGGGGIGSVGIAKVDTSGLKLSQSGDTGGGDTITTNGDHHGNGVQLH